MMNLLITFSRRAKAVSLQQIVTDGKTILILNVRLSQTSYWKVWQKSLTIETAIFQTGKSPPYCCAPLLSILVSSRPTRCFRLKCFKIRGRPRFLWRGWGRGTIQKNDQQSKERKRITCLGKNLRIKKKRAKKNNIFSFRGLFDL